MQEGPSRRTHSAYWLGALALAGCSYLIPIDELVDADGIAPEADAAPPDGGDPVDQGGAGDASADVASSSCPSPSAFCVDFESRGLEAFLEQVTENGSLLVDSTASRSPPSSLLATSDGAGQGDSRVFARTTFSGAPQVVSLTADIRIDQPAADDSAGVLRLAFGNGGYIELIAQTNGLFDLFESSSQTARPTGDLLPIGTWGRFTLRADFSQTPAQGTVLRDGVQIGSAAIGFASDVPQITVGLSFTEHRGWIVRYDDVVFESQ